MLPEESMTIPISSLQCKGSINGSGARIDAKKHTVIFDHRWQTASEMNLSNYQFLFEIVFFCIQFNFIQKRTFGPTWFLPLDNGLSF